MKNDNDKKNDNNYMDDEEIEEIEGFEGEAPLGLEIRFPVELLTKMPEGIGQDKNIQRKISNNIWRKK